MRPADPIGQAVRSLLERPEDDALASRAVKALGRSGTRELVDRLRASRKGSNSFAVDLAVGQVLLQTNDHEGAEAALSGACALRPGNLAAQRARGRALAALGRSAEAAAAFEEALHLARGPRARVELLDALVNACRGAGLEERELSALGEALRLRPREPARVLRLARALQRAGRSHEAAATLEHQLPEGRGPGGAEQLAEAVTLLAGSGHEEAAVRLLRGRLSRSGLADADRKALWSLLIRIGRERDGLGDLVTWVERRLTIDPNSGADWQALAELREELGEYDGAVDAWRRLSELRPREAAPRRRMLELLERLGRHAELEAAQVDLARRDPDAAEAAVRLLEQQFARGERERAQRGFDDAVRRFRDRPDILERLADLASRQGDGDRVFACWDAIRVRAPGDPRAIVGLGEAHYQRGRRELARRTWLGLLRAVRPPAEAHALLAEVLAEHDFLEEAAAEARTAAQLAPSDVARQRGLARILERTRDGHEALAAWHAVLSASVGVAQAAERREARTRIVALLARGGPGRLQAEANEVQSRLRGATTDPAVARELVLLLSDLHARLGDPAGAIRTLLGRAEADMGDAEIVLGLVRLLRQSQRPLEAGGWLERLALAAPSLATESLLQASDLYVQRYQDQRGLELLDRLALRAGEEPELLSRMADVAERAGRPERALAYQLRAATADATGRAGLEGARLLLRLGRPSEAEPLLADQVERASDPQVRGDLVRQAADLAEARGGMAALVRRVALTVRQGGPGARRDLVALLRRALPTLDQEASASAEGAARRRAIARLSLRSIVDVVTEPGSEPDPAAIELLGALGERSSVPFLIRLLQRRPPATRAAAPALVSRQHIAAAVALGRLGDRRALVALLEVCERPEPGERGAALWAVGRLASPEAVNALERAANDARAEIAGFGLLGLGRLKAPRTGDLLARVAVDPAKPADVRRAAALGLGLAGDAAAIPTLLGLLAAPDRALRTSAAIALGPLLERGIPLALWSHALLGDATTSEAALLALAQHAAGGAIADEGSRVSRGRFSIRAVLDGLDEESRRSGRRGAGADAVEVALSSSWAEVADQIGAILVQALASPTEENHRGRALAALDARDDGVGLGALTPRTAGAHDAAVAMALARISSMVADAVANLLDHPDPRTRGAALRVALKRGDRRVTLSPALNLLAVTPNPADGRDAGWWLAEVPTVQKTVRFLLQSGLVTPTAAAASLAPLAAHRSWLQRMLAARVARELGAAGEELGARLALDPDPVVRAEAVGAESPGGASRSQDVKRQKSVQVEQQKSAE